MMEETLKRLEQSFQGIRGDIREKKMHFYLNSSSYRSWSEPSRIELRKSFQKSLNWVLENSSTENCSTSDSISLIEVLWKVKNSEQVSVSQEITTVIAKHLERIVPSDGLFSDIGENPCAFNELSNDFIFLLPVLCEMGVLGKMPAELVAKQLVAELCEQVSEFSDRNSDDGAQGEDTIGKAVVIIDPLRCSAVLNLIYALDLQQEHKWKEVEEYLYECVENDLLTAIMSVSHSETVLSSEDDALYAVAKVVNNSLANNEKCFSEQLKAAVESKLMSRIGQSLDLSSSAVMAQDCAKRILSLKLLGVLEDDKAVRDSVARGELKLLLKKQQEDGSWIDKNIVGVETKNSQENIDISPTLHALLAVLAFLEG